MALGVFSTRHGIVNGGGIDSKKLARLTERAVERKPYCRCCNLPARKHLRLIKLDRQKEATIENLSIVCPVCYSLHNGGYTADGRRQGIMIYLPDLPQTEIIRMWWVLAVNVEEGRGVHKQQARDALIALEGLSAPIEKLFSTSDPSYFANYLDGVSEEAYKSRKRMMGGVRFLPYTDSFGESLLTYRKEGVFLTEDTLSDIEYSDLGGG